MEQDRSRKRQGRRRAPWFMLILFALIVVTAVGISLTVLRSGRASLDADVERGLALEAQNRVSSLTVWYGALRSQITGFTDADLFRLFASEVNALGEETARFLRLAKESAALSEADDQVMPAPGSGEDDLSRLVSRVPLMRKVLSDFTAQSGFLSAALFTTRGQEYLSTEASPEPLSPERAKAVAEALQHGRLVVLPVRVDAGGKLVMDMVQPLFAPSYVAEPGGAAVAALLFSRDVTRTLAEMTRPANGPLGVEMGRVLQDVGGRLEVLRPSVPGAGGAGVRALPGWTLAASGQLPLAVRALPPDLGERAVYSLAIRVPGLPWLVEQDIPVEAAQQPWQTYRSTVILAAAASTIIAALLLAMIWWWLVGRRERAVSAELRTLYQTVNEQRQLLAGINGTLADGIVLEDACSDIRYANEAFAGMVGKTPPELVGTSFASALGPNAANLRPHTERVLETGWPSTFTETLRLPGGIRHYQVACSPFREEGGEITGVVSVYRDITRLVTAQEHAQSMVYQTISVLVRAIEAVDPYLRGQSARSGQLAVSLAQRLGLSPEHETTLRTAANLSQIGMIQLPRTLLAKAGALTPEERAQLERHVDYARDSLEGIDFGLPVLETICQMHERLDGSGYPRHLRGESIGMDARVLAVANTFCALVRPRSYREARSVDQALQILSARPPQYDPGVVDALQSFLSTPAGTDFLQDLRGEEA